MSLDDKHPAYLARLPDWQVLTDCYEGERRIKERGDAYLPPTSSMVENGYPVGGIGSLTSPGKKAYDAYVTRAVFHEFLRDAIVGMVGIIHRKPPRVTAGESDTLPAQLQQMVDSMTINGESMELLWRRITEQQLLKGRCGLLVDVPDGARIDEAVPYVAMYEAEAILNWDTGQRRQGRQRLELVVLDESEFQREQDLTWEWSKQIRICTLSSDVVTAEDQSAVDAGTYVVHLAAEEADGNFSTSLANTTMVQPRLGSTTLDRVPFVFVNVNDLAADPDRPPLLGLANLQLAIYRGEADYRQSLFMQGQDTLVRIGATDEQRVMTGVGAILDLPFSGDAKYIGVSGSGLSEQRQALENDKTKAAQAAIQLLDVKGGAAESGEALRVRVSARTATLISIQHAAAAALREVIQLGARWLGFTEDVIASINVEPNLDFSDAKIDPTMLLTLMQAKQAGLPLADESIHRWLVENEFTSLEFLDEQEKILAEKTDAAAGATDVTIDPNAPDPGMPAVDMAPGGPGGR